MARHNGLKHRRALGACRFDSGQEHQTYARVVQLVDHRTFTAAVAGSSPVSCTRNCRGGRPRSSHPIMSTTSLVTVSHQHSGKGQFSRGLRFGGQAHSTVPHVAIEILLQPYTARIEQVVSSLDCKSNGIMSCVGSIPTSCTKQHLGCIPSA